MKKEPKNFCFQGACLLGGRGSVTKVFCFFFSKKKNFLTPAARIHPHIARPADILRHLAGNAPASTVAEPLLSRESAPPAVIA